MAKRYNKNQAKTIAKEHISNLDDQISVQRFKDNVLAQKYLGMIKRLSRKFRLSLPTHIKRQVCKHCGALLTPGLNSRVRLRNKKRVHYCYECKNYTRTPYSKK